MTTELPSTEIRRALLLADLNRLFFDLLFAFPIPGTEGLTELEQSICDRLERYLTTDSKRCCFVSLLPSAGSPTACELASGEHENDLIGLHQLTEALLADALISGRYLKADYYQRFGKPIWHHARACAVACRELAKVTDLDPGLCYLMGLIHDVGKLAVFTFISDSVPAETAHAKLGSTYFKQFLAETANRMSTLLVSQWAVPEVIKVAINDHAHPPKTQFRQILVDGTMMAHLNRLVKVAHLDEQRCFELLAENRIEQTFARKVFALMGNQ